MGLFDPVIKWIIREIEKDPLFPGRKRVDIDEDEIVSQINTDIADMGQKIDRIFGDVYDQIEDDVLDPLISGPNPNPENVEGKVDDAEGAALKTALSQTGLIAGLEAASVGQIETHERILSEVVSVLALQNVLGRRLGMAMEKGIDPALEAEIAKKTRSEFVALPDAVEFALRTRQGDRGWLGGPNTSDRAFDAVGSKKPVNPNNILEEWGIRDDNLRILEEVSLEAIEAEELLESPIQFGVIPDPKLVEENARRAGLPENIIDLFVEVAEQAPRSSDLWEQRTTTEALVDELDTLVSDGELSPQQAVARLPDEVSEAKPALRDRWELLETVPSKAPTRAQYTNAFAWGLISRDRFEDALRTVDVDPDKHPAVVRSIVLDELDGDLQSALAAGIISNHDYVGLARWAGVSNKAIDSLRRGKTWRATSKAILGASNTTEGSGVDVIDGIGPARANELKSFGIDTLGELANANPVGLASALNVSEEQAANWVESARRRSQ